MNTDVIWGWIYFDSDYTWEFIFIFIPVKCPKTVLTNALKKQLIVGDQLHGQNTPVNNNAVHITILN